MFATVRDQHERKGLPYLCAQPVPLPHLQGLACMMLVMLVRALQARSLQLFWTIRCNSVHTARMKTLRWSQRHSMLASSCIQFPAQHARLHPYITQDTSQPGCSLRISLHFCHFAHLFTSTHCFRTQQCTQQWAQQCLSNEKASIKTNIESNKRVKKVQPPLLLFVGPHEAEHAAPGVQGFCSEAKPFLRSRDE